MAVRTNYHTDEEDIDDIFEQTPRKKDKRRVTNDDARDKTKSKTTKSGQAHELTDLRRSGYGRSASSTDDARKPIPAPLTRTNIAVGRD